MKRFLLGALVWAIFAAATLLFVLKPRKHRGWDGFLAITMAVSGALALSAP